MATYPQKVDLTAADIQRLMQSPDFISRRMQTLGDRRYIGTMLLKGRQDSVGGAVGYELAEGIFADDAPEVVAPGAEYTLTTIGDGPAGTARVAKWGKDSIVTDESIKRRKIDPVNKGLLKLANSAGLVIDKSCTSVIASAVTSSITAKVKWTAADAEILRDVMLAQAAITGLNMGYQPDTLLVDDTVWAYLASDKTISNAMAREDKTNPVYSGRFEVLAGLEVIHVPSANLPGGSGTSAYMFDSNQLGFIAKEDLGGGYQSAGDLVETKVIRDELTDAWRIRARANFAPVVTDPGAGISIKGVA